MPRWGSKHMALKSRYATAAEIPADQKPFYVERDGSFVLDAEGVVEKSKLDEFRTNNIALQKKLDAFNGIDPEEHKKLAEAAKKAEEEKLKAAGNFDKLLEQRTTAMKADYDKKLADEQAARTAASRKLEQVLINDAIATAALSKGIKSSALPDVKNRGKVIFKLDGDKVTAIGDDGQPRFDTTGQPMTIEKWMDTLSSEAPHLFEENRGAGAPPGGGRGNHTGVNPYKAATRNLTLQAKMERENPTLAKQMQAAATA